MQAKVGLLGTLKEVEGGAAGMVAEEESSEAGTVFDHGVLVADNMPQGHFDVRHYVEGDMG